MLVGNSFETLVQRRNICVGCRTDIEKIMVSKILCIYLLYATCTCEAYKVLVVFPVAVKSHLILGDGVVRHLLEAGHEVTYITPFPKIRKQSPLLKEVDVNSLQALFPENLGSIEKLMKKEININLSILFPMFFKVSQTLLEHNEVRKLFSDPEEQFDVVIAEWMFGELYSGISAVFNCPYMWLTSVDPHWMVLKLIDEIPNPAYNSDTLSNNVAPFSFVQRVEELITLISSLSVQYFHIYGTETKEYERLLVPIIQKRGHKVPNFEKLRYNASLILGNSHVSLGQPTRLPQNYKAIGGYHIDDNIKPLPEELKTLLDNAKHGLIYFSMGTNLRSKYLPTEIKIKLLKMFGKLKQTILWKFEEDLPGRPSNVHIVNWAPQQSILAHPNCILFITHGGLLSTTEAIHFGKPIIGIPVFADQFNNVDRFVKLGCAKRVDLSFTMADQLEQAIMDVVTDPSYASNVKERSAIYHDRPVSPGKELVHWVEHVARTGGAPHLCSPALLVPWYQKSYLDLILLVVMILHTVIMTIRRLIIRFSIKQKDKVQ